MNLPALLRHSTLPLLLAVLCLLLALMGPELSQALRYERQAILGGELWRLITAHVLHLGWSHLWLNLAGLALVWALVGGALGTRTWIAVLVICALVISAGLLVFVPSLHWYVGLSGVLHGMLLAGATAGIGRYRDAPLLIAVVLGKLAWETVMGPMPGSEAAAGGAVIVEAHLYGGFAGLLCGVVVLVQRRRRAKVAPA